MGIFLFVFAAVVSLQMFTLVYFISAETAAAAEDHLLLLLSCVA